LLVSFRRSHPETEFSILLDEDRVGHARLEVNRRDEVIENQEIELPGMIVQPSLGDRIPVPELCQGHRLYPRPQITP
jgi:hypothetical protein